MALISCPECSRSLSDQARSCPNCGHPLRKTEYRFHTVVCTGSRERGREELDLLLRQGWQIINEEEEVASADADGYESLICRYKLQR